MLRSALTLSACALISVVSPAWADAPVEATSCTVTAGLKTITVPFPAGYVRCDGINKDFDAGMAGFIPPTNRLLAYFASPADLEGIKNLTGGGHERSFNIQIVKAAEREEIGQRTFAGLKDRMKEELEKARATIDEEIKRTFAAGNEKVKKEYGVDAALSVSGTAFLGFFEETDTALGFTMAMKTKEKNEEGKEVEIRSIAAAVVSPVNGRLLSFYANYPYEKESDRADAEKAVAAWRDAVVAANPQIAGPEAPESGGRRIGKLAGYGIGAALVVGAIIFMNRKKAARAAQ
jgi:hypothetical protein